MSNHMRCDHCESVLYERPDEDPPMVMHRIGCEALTSLARDPKVNDSWNEVRDGCTVTVQECERPDGTGFCRVLDGNGSIITWWELDGEVTNG